MTRIPANSRCTRCKPKKPCLNCVTIWKQGIWLGKPLRAKSLESVGIPLTGRGF